LANKKQAIDVKKISLYAVLSGISWYENSRKPAFSFACSIVIPAIFLFSSKSIYKLSFISFVS